MENDYYFSTTILAVVTASVCLGIYLKSELTGVLDLKEELMSSNDNPYKI